MRNIVLDTNVFLVSISRNSPNNWILQKLILGEFVLCVTNDIILEYTEIIERKMSSEASKIALDLILNLPNIKLINTYYQFNLLKDVDDNKFVDCAIAANAHYIVTQDSDFKILNQIEFPKIKTATIEQFKIILET